MSLYAKFSDLDWNRVDPALRTLRLQEGESTLEGRFRIVRGRGMARGVGWILGLPPAGEEVPVRLHVEREGGREVWTRDFGGHELVTVQSLGAAGELVEGFGPLDVHLRLEVDEGGLHYRQVGCRLRLGRWRIPLPGWLTPRVEGNERVSKATDRLEVFVIISHALMGILVRYEGSLHLNPGART